MKSYLVNLIGKLRESGIDADYKIGYGSLEKTIIETAEEEKAHLIAMATHGFDGLSQSVYGSVAACLVQKVHCPIFEMLLPFRSCEPIYQHMISIPLLQRPKVSRFPQFLYPERRLPPILSNLLLTARHFER